MPVLGAHPASLEDYHAIHDENDIQREPRFLHQGQHYSKSYPVYRE